MLLGQSHLDCIMKDVGKRVAGGGEGRAGGRAGLRWRGRRAAGVREALSDGNDGQVARVDGVLLKRWLKGIVKDADVSAHK